MPIENPKDIRLNEPNDLEAIIGHPPGWTLRWGISIVLLAILLLVLLAWLIRYPDIVEARTVLTTENPPIRLVAKVPARLERFQVKNGQAVEKGEILGILENPAKEEDVFELEKFLQDIQQNDPASFLSINLPEDLLLGPLESAFVQFGKRYEELKYFLQQDINNLKISNLRAQIKELERINRSLKLQVNILAKEIAVTFSRVERDSILLDKNSLSRLEFESTQLEWLQKSRELENLRSNSVQNDLRIRQMEAQILDLRQLRSDDESERMLNFQSGIDELLGEINLWKSTYLLTSPIAGKVALTHAWSEQQYVDEGKEVLTIVPESKAGEIIGKAFLSGPNMGKLETGMTVLLRLDGFPYQEYGVLAGTLKEIATAPGVNGYEAHISLGEGMTTSHDITVPFRQEMQAMARIITAERSYLERVLENFWATFEEN